MELVELLLMVQKSGSPVGMVKVPLFTRVSYIQGGVGFQPSTVVLHW